VDAPCSGLGTLRRKPDARWRLAEGDPERFAAIQRALVRRYAALVRPGGRFVYATCSIDHIENDEVADFAEQEVGLRPAPLARLLGEERARALGAGEARLQLWPHRHGTDGFFVAVFERAGSRSRVGGSGEATDETAEAVHGRGRGHDHGEV
jgi:16S rRNA (cytosine967-C5)-methyltransferase